jgi:tRNA pseudouridine(38-40) synthase
MHTLRSAHQSPCLWNSPWALNDDDLVELCQKLTGTHDFSCFCHKEERRKRDNVMELSRFDVEVLSESNEEAPAVTIKFVLEAKGFRRTMVRNLVGFVVDVCRGQLDMNQVDEVLTGTDEAAELVNAAPACGLCLVKVEY